MNLRRIRVIAAKEFKDVLRDRRTLLFMVALPILVMPLLFMGIAKFAQAQQAKKASRTLTVAVAPNVEPILKALADQWTRENLTQFGRIASKFKAVVGDEFSLPSMAELSDLSMKDLVGELDGLRDATEGGDIGDLDPAVVERAARVFADLSERDLELLTDARKITTFRSKTEFVALGDVEASTTPLAAGVVIPDDLPDVWDGEALALAIQDKTIHAAAHLPSDVFDRIEDGRSVPLTVFHDASVSLSDEAADRMRDFASIVGEGLLEMRLAENDLSPQFAEPLRYESADIATPSRRLQAFLGGLLPYMIIMFSFFGAFYPSLDLTAGEKERFTMETLLLAPASRMELAAGKFIVVFVAAIIASILATTSLGLTFTQGILPQGVASGLDIKFEPLAVWLTAALLIPVSALFAAVLLGVALLARSFKEAQSYTAPLQFIVIVPAMAAMLPDLEAELHLAWIPFLNVSMLMRELLKGNYLWDFFSVTMVSMGLLTVLTIWGASLIFRRETVILRT